MKKRHLATLAVTILIMACNTDPNLNESGKDELRSHELQNELDRSSLGYTDTVYVPIYSDIYVDEQNSKTLLAATLSIRNTSLEDSLFLTCIDYFNTEGQRVKRFIEKPIGLNPMATVNYVIEREDDTGGPGANFIVGLAGDKSTMSPLIQAVMIGEVGNKGFSFVTNGSSIHKSRN